MNIIKKYTGLQIKSISFQAKNKENVPLVLMNYSFVQFRQLFLSTSKIEVEKCVYLPCGRAFVSSVEGSGFKPHLSQSRDYKNVNQAFLLKFQQENRIDILGSYACSCTRPRPSLITVH